MKAALRKAAARTFEALIKHRQRLDDSNHKNAQITSQLWISSRIVKCSSAQPLMERHLDFVIA